LFIAKIYPKGFAGGMKQFSDKFHKILCFDEHPNDYKKILLKFLTFLKVNTIFLNLFDQLLNVLF